MSYYDDFANHIIDTEFYAEAKEVVIESVLEKIKRELVEIINSAGYISNKTKYNQLIKECHSIVEENLSFYFTEEEEERKVQAKKEADFLKELFKDALGITIALSLAGLGKTLLAPFNDKDNIASFKETLSSNIMKSVRTPLLNSYIFGAPTTTVTEQLKIGMDKIKKNAESDIHTLTTSTQRDTQKLLMKNMPSTIKYQYISMLDGRTCTLCGSLSGQIFSAEEIPDVPLHNRCRCYLLPVENVTDEPSYEEWLKTQLDSTVYKILGKSRYFLFKSGISIKEFSSKGHLLTLNELYNNIK